MTDERLQKYENHRSGSRDYLTSVNLFTIFILYLLNI